MRVAPFRPVPLRLPLSIVAALAEATACPPRPGVEPRRRTHAVSLNCVIRLGDFAMGRGETESAAASSRSLCEVHAPA
jgi:hypothetical protein